MLEKVFNLIRGIGTDIIEIQRISKAIERNSNFIKKYLLKMNNNILKQEIIINTQYEEYLAKRSSKQSLRNRNKRIWIKGYRNIT